MKPTSEIQSKKQALEKNIQELIAKFIDEVGASDVKTETTCICDVECSFGNALIKVIIDVKVIV